MILINQERLMMDALNDVNHKHHEFAKIYDDTLKFLRGKYKTEMRYIRPDRPIRVKGADSRFIEIPSMALPIEPMSIPLKANVYVEGTSLGKNLWACCLDAPKLLPGNLWDLGRKRSLLIYGEYLVNVEREPDLAFFLYKISPFTKKGLVKLQDPERDDEEIGATQEAITTRKNAVWTGLRDDKKLRTMARAYGVAMVDEKQPNAIRQELEQILEKNDVLQKSSPIIKGTKEFLEEMHFTDSLLLRAFVQKNIDENKLTWKIDGRWRIGEKVVVQVPANELERKTEYLCSYLLAGNNADKLQEFLRDLINREYLDNLKLEKEWVWLYKVMGENPAFKKKEDMKARVIEVFCPLG